MEKTYKYTRTRSRERGSYTRKGVVTELYWKVRDGRVTETGTKRDDFVFPPNKTIQETIQWSGNGKKEFHACHHTKVEKTLRLGSMERGYTTPSGVWYGTPTRYFHPSWGGTLPNYTRLWFTEDQRELGNLWQDDKDIHKMVDWSKAYGRLLDDAFGLMPDDISVGVNIAEFSQLKKLVPSMTRSIRRILGYVQRNGNKTVRKWKYLTDKNGKSIPWTGIYDRVKLNSLSWCLRDLAGTHLGISFGVLPLADDLGNWLAKYWQVRAHLEWYKHLVDGRWHKVMSRTPGVYAKASTKKGTASWACGPGGLTFNYTAKFDQESETYGVIGAWVRPSAKVRAARVNAIMSQILGLNVPLQIAWDLVPFSFVVDWFLPVGELIKKAEPRRALGGIASSVEIGFHWHSQKTTQKAACVWENNCTVDPSYANQVSGRWDGKDCTYTSTTYTRQAGWPAFNLLPKVTPRYGVKQVLLTLSLLVQKAVRRS